ncbi:MAG: ATP synthase F1 subunit gamma [Bacteroidia bacterium]|nr:ATP synthase F1 subunit gamma [Bacteroidia bacterium]
MPNLKEVRNRIVSVNSTMQITSAMKMVSAAKLRKAQDSILQLRPYANKLKSIIQNVSLGLDISENIYARYSNDKNILIIPISSNRGLAGAFNSNINKKLVDIINQLTQRHPSSNIYVLPIGKKVTEFCRKKKYPILSLENSKIDLYELSEKPKFENAASLVHDILKMFADKKIDHVQLIYNQFKNAAVQYPVVEDFLPIKKSEETNQASVDYIFEPNRDFIINTLIPQSLKTQLYKALLDSNASEHGARMTAMHKATDNAKELIRTLRIEYNKARQASITKEILEIVAGAEALKG